MPDHENAAAQEQEQEQERGAEERARERVRAAQRAQSRETDRETDRDDVGADAGAGDDFTEEDVTHVVNGLDTHVTQAKTAALQGDHDEVQRVHNTMRAALGPIKTKTDRGAVLYLRTPKPPATTGPGVPPSVPPSRR